MEVRCTATSFLPSVLTTITSVTPTCLACSTVLLPAMIRPTLSNTIDLAAPLSFSDSLSRITDDYQAEYIDTDENGNEVHELEVTDEYADWVEQQLDTSDGIISYQEVKE